MSGFVCVSVCVCVFFFFFFLFSVGFRGLFWGFRSLLLGFTLCLVAEKIEGKKRE